MAAAGTASPPRPSLPSAPVFTALIFPEDQQVGSSHFQPAPLCLSSVVQAGEDESEPRLQNEDEEEEVPPLQFIQSPKDQQSEEEEEQEEKKGKLQEDKDEEWQEEERSFVRPPTPGARAALARKDIVCEICGVVFRALKGLRTHQKSHQSRQRKRKGKRAAPRPQTPPKRKLPRLSIHNETESIEREAREDGEDEKDDVTVAEDSCSLCGGWFGRDLAAHVPLHYAYCDYCGLEDFPDHPSFTQHLEDEHAVCRTFRAIQELPTSAPSPPRRHSRRPLAQVRWGEEKDQRKRWMRFELRFLLVLPPSS